MALRKCKECGKEVSSKASACPNCGAPVKNAPTQYGCGGYLVLLLIGILLLSIIPHFLPPPAPETAEQRSERETRESKDRQAEEQQAQADQQKKAAIDAIAEAKTEKEKIRGQIKLDWEWRKGGFDNIMEADFKITNGSDHDIKDVEIRTVQAGKSGTRIDGNTRTIYEIIKARQTKEFKKFNMGFIHSQSNSASARITDFVVIQ